MLDTYETYIRRLQAAYAKAQEANGSLTAPPPPPPLEASAPVALLFSPLPDAEVINGALPLRLRHQARWRVINVAVTLGDDPARRPERQDEARDGCQRLGFDFHVADQQGLERVHLETRRQDPHHWTYAVGVIARLILEFQPRLVAYPHSFDAHPTFIGTHALVRQAMVRLGEKLDFYCLETEWWSQAERPNLLVESSVENVVELVTALSLHRGEVARNPYHLRLPAWMMDNVRRGAELVQEPDLPAPDILFATLYRVKAWRRARYTSGLKDATLLSVAEDPSEIFPAFG